jgi:hypothetical protein
VATTLSQLAFWKSSNLLSKISNFNFRSALGKAGVPVFNPYGQGRITSTEKEFGFDLGFKSKRKRQWFSDLQVSITHWQRSSPGAPLPIQYEMGGSNYFPGVITGPPIFDAYSISSQGLQFSLNSKVLVHPKVEWSLTTFFNRYDYHLDLKGTGGLSFGYYYLPSGENLNMVASNLIITSLDQRDANGIPYIPLSQQGNYTVASNGIVVNSTTREPFLAQNEFFKGDPNPKFNMSFINSFKLFRIVSVSFQLDWFYKNHLFNDAKWQMYLGGYHPDYTLPLTINGATGAWTAFYSGNAGDRTNFFYEDASFVRLRNVAFGLNLADMMKIKKMRKLKLEFSGRNVLTWTNYSGMDPEANSGEPQSGWQRGIDKGYLPNSRSFQIGLSVGL